MKGVDSSKHHEPRRRVTNIHVDSDKDRSDRSTQQAWQLNASKVAKHDAKLAKPTDKYEFRSKGLSNRDSFSNKLLSWEATFDRKIEHFVYPSLQTLDEPDIELLDEKAEERDQLHGHYGSRNPNLQKRRRSSVIDTSKLSSRTPSIVGKLTTGRKLSYINSPSFERKNQERSATRLAQQDVEEQPIDYNLFVEEPLKWRVIKEDLPTSARRKFEEDSTFNELLHKADKYMKDKMRADYETRLVDKVKEKKEFERLGLSDASSRETSKKLEQRKRRATVVKKRQEPSYNDKTHMFLSGENLYDTLREDGRKRRDRILKSLEGDSFGTDVYRTEEEVVRDVQRNLKSLPEVELAATVKGGLDHLYDGLLYYQIKNTFNTHDIKRREMDLEHPSSNDLWGEDRSPTSKTIMAGTLTPTMKFPSPNSSKPTTPSIRGISSREGLGSREGSRNLPLDFEIGNDFHDKSPGLRSSVRRALSSMHLGFDEMEEFTALNSLTDGFEHDVAELKLQKRSAQDKLLYDQLKAGILPENLFRRGNTFDKMFILDLNYYNLGDEMGLCLGESLMNYQSISCLKLRECRLSAKSLPTIVKSMSRQHLRELDLSYNDLHGEAAKSLSHFFMEEPTVLENLWLTKGQIRCSDIDMIMKGLIMHSATKFKGAALHRLKKLYLDNNDIKCAGAQTISFYLKLEGCKLSYLDMKWNDIGVVGAERMAEALQYLKKGEKTSSCPLKFLNLSCNSLDDSGAQSLCSALAHSSRMEEMHLTNNNIGTKACFILSKSIQGHPSMRLLDISSNPLGEAGARCLFRIIVKSFIKCFVVMKSCTFKKDPNAFNSSNPTTQSPYILNTSDPYESALLHELMNLYLIEENNLVFESFSVKVRTDQGGKKGKASYGTENFVNLTALDGKVVEKSTKKQYEYPHDAIVRVAVNQHKKKPTVSSVCSQKSLDLMIEIIANASSEMDRRNWIQLITADLYFTTEQVDYMMKYFEDRMISISKLTIFENVWKKLLDTENKYDFLCKHLKKSADRIDFINSLVSVMTIEAFRFNWINCTGHWYLDLSDARSRDIMINMMALNTAESTEAQEHGRREDTSQRKDWSNFRNEKYRGEDISIKSQFEHSELPTTGLVEFDYVCTTRPKTKEVKTITLQERELLFDRIGFSKRTRCPKSKCLVAFLELQVASTKYFFKVNDVIYIMHGFDEENKIQVKVVTTLFSRIADLENFHQILRILPQQAQDDIAIKLGWLNIMNPILPYHTFNMKLTHDDNRFVANMLLSLGSQYEDNNCKEVKGTEVLLIDAYASLNRLLHDSSPKCIKFTYNQITDKSIINWNQRLDKLHYFLLGTYPVNKANIFKKPFDMYKEMVEEKSLSRGPLDLQYREYLRSDAKQARDMREMKASKEGNRKRSSSSYGAIEGPNEKIEVPRFRNRGNSFNDQNL